jgi:hypothetical protein
LSRTSLRCALIKQSVARVLLALMILTLATQTTSTVLAGTQQLFDETIVVKNLAYFAITRTIDISAKTNVRLQGSVDVISGGGSISVYVMDADGYEQYQASRQARQSALYKAEDVASQTLSLLIAKSGTYYVVLDNENSLISSKTVRVQLNLAFDDPFLGSTPFYAIIGVAVVVVAGVVVFIFMRKRGSGKVGGSSSMPVLDVEGGLKKCVFCGAAMHEMARTCAACGKQQA